MQLTFQVPCCLPNPQLYLGRALGIASLDFDISEEWDVILVGQGLVQRSHAIFEAAEGIINNASVGEGESETEAVVDHAGSCGRLMGFSGIVGVRTFSLQVNLASLTALGPEFNRLDRA